MIITGIEVIRGNPGTLAAQIDPGFLVEAVPPEKLELTYGDKLRITTGFDYRGPAHDITLYGSIGNRKPWIEGGFDEIISAEAKYKTPNSPTAFAPVTASVDVPITANIAPKPDYDIYCKIKEYPGAGLPQVDDVITITGIPPTFKLLEETIYPYAYIYEGKCEVTTFTFTTIPFTPANWISGKLAAAVESEVRKAGGKIMEMRVYVDENLLRPWTNWRIETVTRPQTTGVAMSLGVWWLGPAILLALAIILTVIVATLVIKPILAAFKRNPALKDVKPGWKKETLILTIQDSEEYWKRTPTPVETLQGMSEEELREYLDKIAEEEVPPVEGLGLAIAAAGVLGLGALALGAYAMSQPRETKKK